MKRKKIGIMGGTFDPLHNGHLAIARIVKEKLALDEVVFIPDNIPPHKLAKHWSSAQDRYKMTELGIQWSERFRYFRFRVKTCGHILYV
jgi:nicotinate-nucleotide adenylyltransferase